MATIHNSNLTKELIDVGKLQVSRDKIPNELAEKVVPVINVNPKDYRIANVLRYNTCTNATNATIYTTPADRDTYITNIMLAFIKDATATSTGVWINFVIDGATRTILHYPCLTLTAQTGAITLALPSPIKVDRNTAITVNSSTNVGNISASGSIIGYSVENINA